MKYSDHVVIERPHEEVFLWLFQPQHIVQLITLDPTKDIEAIAPIPERFKKYEAKDHKGQGSRRRLWEQTEAGVEIQNLSTPTLQAGTTFQYSARIRRRAKTLPEGLPETFPATFPEFPDWKTTSSGLITITSSVSPTSFAFKLRSGSYFKDHMLTFQTQQEKTLLTYTVSTHSGKVGSQLAWLFLSALGHGLNSFIILGEMVLWQQLVQIKARMEEEID